MIKVTSLQTDPSTKKATVSLFSDTKAEVDTTEIEDIVGFPDGYQIDAGSSIITAAGDFAFRKSDGSWSWV